MAQLPWTLAWARLRKHPLRTFSFAIAVSLALISLLTLQGISHSTGNSLVSYSLSKLPTGDRTLTLTSNRIITSRDQYRSINTYLSEHLTGLATGELTREVLYHEISDPHGVGFYFGGVDGLTKSIVLASGRLPTTCNPSMCEVIQVGGQKNSPPRPESLGLKIVGTGSFQDSQLFTGTMAPSTGTPILVADGISASSILSRFVSLQGANGWVGKIDLARIGTDGANSYIESMLAFENQLSIDHSEVTLTWPQDALGEANDQAKSIFDKFVLLDFVVGALLIAFLILFSLRQRREHQQFRAGLSRIGTPKKTLSIELVIEYGAPLILGALIAFLISLLIPGVLSSTHFHANFFQIYEGWPKYLFLVLASLGLITGSTIIGDKAWRRQSWIPYFLGLLFLAGYFLQSGTHELRSWVIPFAYTLIPAFISYYVLRGASSLLRNKSNQTYVLFREHLSMWQGVAAILTLASILAVIALSFDSGISQKVVSQSQDQVPLDISLRTGPALIRPLDLGGTEDYKKVAPGSKAYPVLRSGTAVRNQSSVSDTLSLIGIPHDALSAMPDRSLRHLSSTLTSSKPTNEVDIKVGSSKEIVVTLAKIPKEIDLLGWFRTPHGTHLSAMFAGHGDARTLSLEGQIPSDSSLLAFEFRETSDYLSRRLHAMGEGSFAVPMLKGTGSIESVAFDGHIQALQVDIWHQRNFSYAFNGGSLYVRPAVTLGIPQVVVDPTTALLARNGLLTLTGASDSYFQVRVGAVSKSFPSADDRFVIMDLEQLQNEIAQSDLGATDPIELWVSTPDSEKYLRNLSTSHLQGLIVQSRNDLEKELRSNPTNVGLNGSYRVSLFFALLLAIFMYASALPLLYKESAGVLFQLEASGVRPRQLRRALRGSLRLAVSVALLIGAGIGLLVAHFFISDSTPYALIVLTLVASIALSEIGGYLFTRRFFSETTMAGPRV